MRKEREAKSHSEMFDAEWDEIVQHSEDLYSTDDDNGNIDFFVFDEFDGAYFEAMAVEAIERCAREDNDDRDNS